jgi:hypothetical protein
MALHLLAPDFVPVHPRQTTGRVHASLDLYETLGLFRRKFPDSHVDVGLCPYETVANRLRARILFPNRKKMKGAGINARVMKAKSPVAHWNPRPSYICTPNRGNAAGRREW